MRRINWLAIFPLLFFVGIVYLIFAPEIFEGREIRHFMLATSGLMWGLLCVGLATVTQWDGLSRQKGWWRTALSVLNAVALGVAFLGTIAGITGAGLSEIAQDVFVRHQTAHTIALFAAAYFIVTLLTVRNRFEVAEDTIVILDGKVLYPGAKFRLWPWFRYRARTVEQQIKVPSTVMNLDFSDGTFAVEVASTTVSLMICTGESAGITSLDYSELIDGITTWVRGLARKQARPQTLGTFLQHKFDVEAEEIAGFLVIWRGEVKIKLV